MVPLGVYVPLGDWTFATIRQGDEFIIDFDRGEKAELPGSPGRSKPAAAAEARFRPELVAGPVRAYT